MEELPGGIRRVTLPLPTRPGHVHAYLIPGEDGWTIVDCGLGLPDAAARWRAELAQIAGPVARIVITHFHPDHVGAAADIASLTGAPVVQGRVDYEQCALVWGGEDWSDVLVEWFARHGVPAAETDELVEQGSLYRPFVRYQPDLPKRLAFPAWSVGAKSRELNELLFEHGMDASRPDWLGITPLHQFARTGDVDKAALFLDHGADLHARDQDICSTPLGWAAKFGQAAMVELLLSRGARPNLTDDPPWATPLAWAARRGHADVVRLLS